MSSPGDVDVIATKKRKMMLDLSAPPAPRKRFIDSSPSTFSLFPGGHPRVSPGELILLTSPDVHQLTMSTPEVEQMLQGVILMPTPSPTTPGRSPFSPLGGAGSVTSSASLEERQEAFRQGYQAAMAAAQASQVGAFLESARHAVNYPMFPSPYLMHGSPAQHPPPQSPLPAFTVVPVPHGLLLGNSPTEERHRSAFVPHSRGPLITMGHPSPERSSRSPTVSEGSSEYAQTVPSPASSFTSSYHGSMGYNDAVSGVSDALYEVDASCRERNDVRRERNRVAAQRCRQRKVDKIWVLEERVQLLKSQNEQFRRHADSLRDVLVQLKRELKQHLQHGCNVFGEQ
ncbi:hypothetical protein BV898_12183 [Hypsibius exemplaris]|uniref:BZIP domain-containing protein n=1 Tax=Hypsibius exemplaris TaxID=2072580 RepID=A0A1W0WEB2_HYPEX|nr:hypothetical protein BV898_12183 [Hypsibius exemplaris]